MCLDSLAGLSYKDKEIIFIDNASTDGSLAFILKNYPQVRVISNRENLGYAGGANQAVEISAGEFVMILNPDIILAPDYLNVLMQRMHGDPKIGAIIGKLKAYDFAGGKTTNLIDSAGLLMFRNRRCVDRGQGEEDAGQFNAPGEVFGVTGACPLYRKKTLEDCKVSGEYFDNAFFSYKEDVDISWRMRIFGWKCFYEPEAIAYHGRGTGIAKGKGLFTLLSARRGLSKLQKYYSYKNERLMRVKNDMWPNVCRDLLPIFCKEFLIFMLMVFQEPFLWKSFFQFLVQLPGALWKRREIMKKKRVSAGQMGKWFQ